ncbi:glycosyltransferase [Aerococcus urinaeequi]|uniref:glycosyltransferase n=1 Tax=Aerococcus urinaeequi TaxID=51665 RepID=UPI003D6A1663
MELPLVSIIMPVYNVENYLAEAINSIFEQTYNNIELIAINDGSSDSSSSILKKYLIDNPLVNYIIINQKNMGLSGARNSGLEKARGDYIYFFDSDDIIEKDCISDLVTFALNTDVEVIRFNAQSFFDKDYKNQDVILPTYDEINIDSGSIYKRDEYISRLDRVHSPVWLYFYKSEIIFKNNLNFQLDILHEDELFTPIALYYTDRIGYLNKPYFKRRYRTGSIMTENSKEQGKRHVEGYKVVIEQLRKFEKNNKLSSEYIAYLKRIYKRIGTTIFASSHLPLIFNIKLLSLGVNPITAIYKKVK